MRKVTLAAVARESGVTHQTASRILGDKAALHAEDTVLRVRAVAKALGYRPHASAQALRSGASATIALLTDPNSARSALPAALLAGVMDGLQERGWHLALDRHGDEQLVGRGFVPQVLQRVFAQGALVNIHGTTALPIAERLAMDGVPSIWLNHASAHNAVHFDDQGATEGLTTALLERSAKRLLYCDEGYRSAQAHHSRHHRLAGFEQVARNSGVIYDTWLEAPGRTTSELAHSLTEKVRTLQPTGIVCYSTRDIHILIGHVLPELGLRPDRDVTLSAVGSFGDVRHLPILAMVQPWQELGKTAIGQLAKRIDADADQPTISLPCTFDSAPGETLS